MWVGWLVGGLGGGVVEEEELGRPGDAECGWVWVWVVLEVRVRMRWRRIRHERVPRGRKRKRMRDCHAAVLC